MLLERNGSRRDPLGIAARIVKHLRCLREPQVAHSPLSSQANPYQSPAPTLEPDDDVQNEQRSEADKPASPKSSLSFRAAVLAAGNGVTTVVQMVVAAFLARYLSQAEYGTYKQTYLTFSLLVPLLSLGLPAALLYFIPKNEARERGVVLEVLLLLSAGGLAFSAFLLLGGANLLASWFNNPALSTTLKWFAILPAFSLVRLIVSPALIAKAKPMQVAFFSITGGILRLVLVLGAIFLFSFTALSAVLGGIAAEVLMIVPAAYLLYAAIRKGNATPTKSGMSELVLYAVPLGIGSMIATIHKGMDKVIVSTMVDPAASGIFMNGAMELPFISLLTGSAAAVMVPAISSLYADGKLDDALNVFRRSAIKCGTLLAPIAGWFFVSAPWVMTTLYGSAFIGSTDIFRIYLFVVPLRVAFFGPLFQAAGRSDLVLKTAIVGIVGNVLLTIVGAKLFGPPGAAIGTVLSILLFAYAYCFTQTAKLYKCSLIGLLPLKQLAKLFVPVVVLAGALVTLSNTLGWSATLSLPSWLALSVIYAGGILFAYSWLEMISLQRLWSEAKSRLNRLGAR